MSRRLSYAELDLEDERQRPEEVVVLVVGDVGPYALVVRAGVQQVAPLEDVLHPPGPVRDGGVEEEDVAAAGGNGIVQVVLAADIEGQPLEEHEIEPEPLVQGVYRGESLVPRAAGGADIADVVFHER